MMVHPLSGPSKQIHEKPVSRVTALDAADLDSEIQRILKQQLLKIVHSVSPSCGKWEPELDLFLHIVIWKLSIQHLGATFGQQLLSVRYDRSLTRRKATVWAALTIGSRYLHQRSPELTRLVVHARNRDKVNQWLERLEMGMQIALMLNLLMFLREGVFPSLADRLVGVRPVAATSASRMVGYSFMTRELLWHGFIELIVFILPLVNLRSVQRSLRKSLGLGVGGRVREGEPLVLTLATRCVVCQQPPVLPHHMGCAHCFCYYCLQSNRAADIKFECPVCGHATEDPEAVQAVTSKHCRSL